MSVGPFRAPESGPAERMGPYRSAKLDARYEGAEHAPVCRWCKWKVWRLDCADECHEPTKNPAGAPGVTCNSFNSQGKCDRYAPSWWTRTLQVLRLRPWVERPSKEPCA